VSFAELDSVIQRARAAWRPPPRLSLSEWADTFYVLSPETAAEPGRWTTIPYQRGIMDAITDPLVEQVTMMKSSRVGFTLMVSAAMAYFIKHAPSSMLVVQPTVDDAKNFSKETIASMLRDVPCLRGVVFQDDDKGARNSSNTLTHKKFRGGVLSLTGANSGTGFRRIGRRVLFGDEVDAYPLSAGPEGDPLRLAKMRTQAYWNRKIVIGSTPLVAGTSRIAEEFMKGDQRRYFVPCPQCGHMDFLTFREQPAEEGAEPRGHFMKWPDGKPREAFFVCRKNGCIIEHKDKRWMVERGEWRADAEFHRHASFHIWAAYSYMPNSAWGDIAEEFVSASSAGVEQLKTFVNTVLGECWVEKGEAPEWQRLYRRREPYERGRVPAGALFLTAGMDVQKDRLIWEVVAWMDDRQSWSVEKGVIPGDPAKDETWAAADELLDSTWAGADGGQWPIRMLGVDSGYETQAVYNWARRHVGRVIACKGSATQPTLVGSPTPVDVNFRGKRIARGCKVWPVGVDQAKTEFYGWLRLEPPEGGALYPPGYCHFPGYDEDFFKQITAEHRVKVKTKTGYRYEYQVLPNRENHHLDTRIYARAATGPLRLDAIAAGRRKSAAAPPPAPRPPAAEPEAPPAPAASSTPVRPAEAPARGSWLHGGRGGTLGGGGWIRRKR
jgi:phage terminase large subunit GpA-like protein